MVFSNLDPCLQHTFYGIESHRCMEATPSLACANKCVFCWRHHSNPVGTEWKWAMDQPEMIIDGAIENHYKMIRQVDAIIFILLRSEAYFSFQLLVFKH
jgi:tRNA wybutosine-synthesizing protein 1